MAFGTVYRSFWHVLRADGFLHRSRRKYGLTVINKSGSDIATDQLVCISGYDSTTKLPKIVLADADASTDLASDVFVTIHKITNNKSGPVFKGAQSAANLNTNGASVGDTVYLSTTAGGFSLTNPPSGTNARQQVVGYVHVVSSTVGQIIWDIKSQPTKISALDMAVSNGRSTAQTAAVASLVTFTPPADGTYEVCGNVTVTASTTHSFTMQLTYQDENAGARTLNLPFRIDGSTTAVLSTMANTDATKTYVGVPIRIRAKSGVAILVATAGTFTSVTYNAEAQIRQIA